MYLTADRVSVDSDEGEFTLEIYSVDGDQLTLNIHGIDLDAFYDSVKARIGPYLRERDEARRTLPVAFMCNPDESGGLTYERGVEAREEFDAYERSDPKHPAFHSTHADIWDARCTK